MSEGLIYCARNKLLLPLALLVEQSKRDVSNITVAFYIKQAITIPWIG